MTDPIYSPKTTDQVYNPYRSNQDGLFMFRYEEGDKTVTFEVGGGQHLSHMLNEIKLFLQASGYGFHANEDLEVVDNSYTDDNVRDEWADADLDGWENENDDGQMEFNFNGTKQSDFDEIRTEDGSLIGAAGKKQDAPPF